MHHWRDSKHEVDLVFDHPDETLKFEIGSSPEHTRGGMRALVERHPRFAGRCYLIAPQVAVSHPTKTSAGTFPLDLFLQIVGAHAEAALATNLGGGG